MRLIAYTRVSTGKQAEGESLDAQRARIAAYCTALGHAITVELSDPESGENLDRPGFRAALALVEAKAADGIIVTRLDRLSRSVRDTLALVDEGMGSRWALISIAESLDFTSAAGQLVLTVLMAFAEWERKAIGERTRAVMAHKRTNGEYCGGHVPFGMRLAVDGTHLEPDPATRAVVEFATGWHAAGAGYGKIAARLERMGILPAAGTCPCPACVRRRSRTRPRWYKAQIATLLRRHNATTQAA